ncbi:MAG: methyltransferase domain-containing protein [Acidimicrobiia bacterium]|nr:methyltransferase domain-containing protein [Acidimicrobiia bacterium]
MGGFLREGPVRHRSRHVGSDRGSPGGERCEMTMNLQRRCPVCGGREGRLLHTQEFAVPAELAAPEVVDIVTCVTCGMCFSEIAVDQDSLDTAYAEHSKYADTSMYADEIADDAPPTDAPWDLERLRGTAQWLTTRVPVDARVLDAGCATGALIRYLQETGFSDIVGLDPSPVAAATVQRSTGVRAVAGSLFHPPDDLGEFGLVVLSHVLEHLLDVRGAVEGLRSLTKPGGLIYVEVPDAVRYRDHLVAPFHDFNTEHINHFSGVLLDRLFCSAGFVTREIGHKTVLSSPSDPYPAVFGLFERSSPSDTPTAVQRDDDLAPSLRDYIYASTQLMERFGARVHDEVGDGPIVVWGAGQLSMKLLAGPLREARVDALVDTSPDKWGLRLGGHEVVGPDEVASSDSPILVASVHHQSSIVAEIARRLPGRRVVTLR